jgi:hydrogenase expression/formation protein HypC
MCLAIPAKIISINQEEKTATVDYGGIEKETRTDLVDAKEGDYVLIHAGFAIEIIDEDNALKSIEAIDAMIDGGTK